MPSTQKTSVHSKYCVRFLLLVSHQTSCEIFDRAQPVQYSL